VKEFYIDNCCAWCKKLQNLFGQEMQVYLDIFHAVQRVGKKIPKRHKLRYECVEEFRLVFQEPTDLGKNRTKPTPEPKVIQENVERFLKRWKDAECQGTKVLTQSALKEIDNLRIHIQKGCLSGIKPGRGTNRNEELHKDLNKIFSSSRYGVELAYALFTTCFYRHNEKISARENKRPEYPIDEYKHLHVDETSEEKFGLPFRTVVEITGDVTLRAELPTNPQYIDIFQSISTFTNPSLDESEQCGTSEGESCDHNDSGSSDATEENEGLTLMAVKQILLQVVASYYTLRTLTACTSTATFASKYLPFMNSVFVCPESSICSSSRKSFS